MDPRRILFTMSEPRPLPEDARCEGIACKGCIFDGQPVAICNVANAEAIRRGMQDCDQPDQDGQYITYIRVAVDPRQGDLLDELDGTGK